MARRGYSAEEMERAASDDALISRAIEMLRHGSATDQDDGHTQELACLNCGTTLVGPHCHGCGQKAHVHRTLGAVLHDLLHGALHFEGKIWRTLPLLAIRPGELTRRYIEGERVRFVSPMALFLFCIFLMFAVFQASGITAPTRFSELSTQDAQVQSAQSRQELAEERTRIQGRLADMAAGDPARTELEAELRAIEVGDDIAAVSEALVLGEGDASDVRTGWGFIDKGIGKWRENPGLMLYKLQANGYKFSWLLIPLSIPFVWLVFAWRRKFGAYDHAVFVTYSLSFMTLLYVVLTILAQIGLDSGWGLLLGSAVPVLHIYRQLKGAYGLSRFSAMWRTIMLSGFVAIIMLIFANLLLLLGVIG